MSLKKVLDDAIESVIKHLPGFVSANIHRGLDGRHVANYAQWESREAMEAMLAHPAAQQHLRDAAALARFEPNLYEVASVHHRKSPMRYWIWVTSREHVLVGVRGGFAKFNHGKLAPAKRPAKGDWIVYYSGREKPGEPSLYQRFVAIGQFLDAAPTQVTQAPGFKPWRRSVAYCEAIEIPIRPLIEQLSFIKNKANWSATFRFGFLEIAEDDFSLIAKRMISAP